MKPEILANLQKRIWVVWILDWSAAVVQTVDLPTKVVLQNTRVADETSDFFDSFWSNRLFPNLREPQQYVSHSRRRGTGSQEIEALPYRRHRQLLRRRR